MKLNLYTKSLLIALFVLSSGGTLHAEEVVETFTFSEMGFSNAQSVTSVTGTNITITFNKGSNNIDPSYYNIGTAIRVYGGGFFTVTANGNTIKKIVLGFGSGDGTNKINTDVGTCKNGIWTGDVESLKFTIDGSSGHRRIASIVVTYDFEQGQGTEDPLNSFTNATENATVGVPYTVQEITTPSTGRRSYASSDESVATIDGSGNVTLKKEGETTITVTTAADDTYTVGSASYTLIVSKGTPVLSFASEIVTVYIGTDQNGPTLTNPVGGAVTYDISDSEIAVIRPTGYIHPLKGGTATVTATTAETDAWYSASTSYTLKVKEPVTVNIDAVGTYELVTDASTLKDGDQVLIAYIQSSSVGCVLGAKKTNNFDKVDLNNGAISTNKSSFEIKTEKEVTAAILEGSLDGWFFHTNEGYLCATSSSNNYLGAKSLASAGDNAKASISISAGNATIQFQGSNSRNTLKYNSQSGSTLFSCYASNNSTNYIKPVQLYRKVDSQTLPKVPVSFDESLVEITYGDNYDKQKATADGYSGDLVYTSSDESIVKFHGNNVIDVLGPGTVTITATAPTTETTSESSTTYTLKIYEPTDHEINLTFSSAGYLTWGATADIDFSETAGVTAYKITEATSKKITMVEVDKVPKGAAVMLKGSGTVTLTRTSGVEAFTDNVMKACTDGSITGNGVGGVTNTDVYVLGNGNSGLGFYMLKGTLQAGKGYLQVSEGGGAKPNFIGFEETTGVKTVVINNDSDAAIYNLQGVRVIDPQKGIYVKNGKKYVIK